ncbi:MAG: hypothetical protein Q8L53_04220 [Aestuariivirga sp.]|nr:hypothetical protein [Aestuariivirga sp.]
MKTIVITITVLFFVAATGLVEAKPGSKLQSSISTKHDQRDDGIAQNFK